MILLICRIKHFPFLASGHTKSITVYEPFQITANVMDASERSISIPSVDAEDLFGFFLLRLYHIDNLVNNMNLGCSQFSSQRKYVISESMLSSGSFGHVWMARSVADHSLSVLKRIRIVTLPSNHNN